MCDHLKTRLIFIDTSAFEDKNFQFGEYALGKLERHLADQHLYLLITSITVDETLAHMMHKTKEAKSLIKKFKKEAMYLRNIPDILNSGVFDSIDESEIFSISKAKFDDFISNSNAEVVDLSLVDAQEVFSNYFESKPPFGGADKKSEFPDAFCLEAIKIAAKNRGHDVYIISKDKDMQRYAEATAGFHHLESIDELLDIVVRTELQLTDPIKFAEFVSDNISKDIIQEIKDMMENAEFYSDGFEEFDTEIYISKIENISILRINIIDASREEATLEVNFQVDIEASYSYPDYDRSPWDPEDKEYVFVLHNSIVKRHHEQYSCYVTLNLNDGLLAYAEVENIEIDSVGFELSDSESEVLSFKEFDINGD